LFYPVLTGTLGCSILMTLSLGAKWVNVLETGNADDTGYYWLVTSL